MAAHVPTILALDALRLAADQIRRAGMSEGPEDLEIAALLISELGAAFGQDRADRRALVRMLDHVSAWGEAETIGGGL